MEIIKVSLRMNKMCETPLRVFGSFQLLHLFLPILFIFTWFPVIFALLIPAPFFHKTPPLSNEKCVTILKIFRL